MLNVNTWAGLIINADYKITRRISVIKEREAFFKKKAGKRMELALKEYNYH